ncbi:MAG: histidine kinase [Saprospiraceae bacterium]|nr:histidine kinase [Saprospiraceae bacterium]
MSIIKYIKNNRTEVLVALLIGVLLFFINIGILIAEDIAEGVPIKWTFYFINEGTGTFIGLMSVPFLFYFFRLYPFEDRPFVPNLLLHLGVSAIYGLIYTSIMYGSRIPLYSLFDIPIGEKFTGLSYRYLMEYFKQFSTFWLLYIVHRLIKESRIRRENAVKAAELERLLVQSELEALQMRLNPHFFFNTLNTISSLIYDQPAKADQLITHLGDFFRKVLTVQDKALHPIREEIRLTEQYIAIMKGRFEENLQVDFSIDTAAEQAMTPILLFQPLVENAIQYGMKHKNTCHATISITKHADQLHCKVEDDGPGIAEGRFPQQMGIGLHTVMSRLERLYPDQHQFSLHNKEEGGLCIEIKFPYHAPE